MGLARLAGPASALVLAAVSACGGTGSAPAVAAAEPAPAPAVELAPAPPEALPPPVRLVIPKLGVDAAVETRGVGADGVSQTPADPHDVAWYDFSSRPGENGIALFAAHKDWYGIGPTVFYRLATLRAGDQIEVRSQDGKLRAFRVNEAFDVDPASRAGDLMTGTAGSIVLYTCDGAFDTVKGEYTRRFVVKAEPILS